jgi:hypothetical protein
VADAKISQLSDGAPIQGGDVFPVERAGTTYRITASGLYIPGGTDVAVADGGTGASTAAAARTNLGVAQDPIPYLPGVAAAGPIDFISSGNPGANWAQGHRVVMPKTGTLSSVIIYHGSTVAGNVDVGVFSISGDNRTRLWSSGSTAMATANIWKSYGNPGISVTQGDIYDFVLASDSATATFGRLSNIYSNVQVLQLPAGYPNQATLWSWGISASFPLPASFTAIGTNYSGSRWLVLGLVT